MLKPAFAVLCILAAACASGRRAGACLPLEQEFLTAGPAFRDCEVTQRAQYIAHASVEFNDRPMGPNGCYIAEFDVVVDTTGHPIASTAKTLRSSNTRFTEAVRSTLEEVRYSPALKDGRKVQQLVRYKQTYEWVTKAVLVQRGSAPPMTPPSSTERVPRC